VSFKVGGVPHAIDQEVAKPFDWQEALGFKFFQCLLTDGHISAPHVKHYIIMAVDPEAFEPYTLHRFLPTVSTTISVI